MVETSKEWFIRGFSLSDKRSLAEQRRDAVLADEYANQAIK